MSRPTVTKNKTDLRPNTEAAGNTAATLRSNKPTYAINRLSNGNVRCPKTIKPSSHFKHPQPLFQQPNAAVVAPKNNPN